MKLMSIFTVAGLMASSEAVNLVELLTPENNLATLAAAVGAAGLTETVRSGEFTVFAPNDDAFTAIQSTVDFLLANDYSKEILKNIILAHVAPGTLNSTQFLAAGEATTVEGSKITPILDPLSVRISKNGEEGNTAELLLTDVKADNGVAHVIGSVLLPPGLPQTIGDTAGAVGLSTLLTVLSAASEGVRNVLTTPQAVPLTVFAPTNEAFGKLLSAFGVSELGDLPVAVDNVLLYHVVNGSALESAAVAGSDSVSSLGGSFPISVLNLATTDVSTLQGIVHVVNDVILPPVTSVLADNGFQTLTTAAVAAGVVGTVNAGNLTLFAPTDAAFEAVPELILEHLLLPNAYNKDLLFKVLAYHVAPGFLNSAAVGAATSVETLNGDLPVESVDLSADLDIYAGTSLVHKINNVLIPSGFPLQTIAEVMNSTGQHTVLLQALAAVGYENVFVQPSAEKNAWTVFAPTDAALIQAAGALGLTPESFLANKPLVTAVLNAHVVPDALNSEAVTSNEELTTLGGEKIKVASIPLDTTIDVMALNGYVHVLKGVIVPPSALELINAGNTKAPTPSSASGVTAAFTLMCAAALRAFF